MRINKGFLLAAIFIIFCISFTSAQEVKQAEQLKVHQIKGKDYYIHIVEKGNTLYSISRLYSVPIEILKSENPRLTKELTIGDRLLIPLDEVKRKDLSEKVDIDGNYIIYEVQRKNTLYSIAKEYNISVNDIITANPGVEEGLKKKMKLKIPVAKIKGDTNHTQYIQPAESSPYVTHIVEEKETLYSLSKAYKVSIDSILKVNNGLIGGLRKGELINLPIIRNYKDTTQLVVAFDSTAIKGQYKIALLLPLYLDMLGITEEEAEFKDIGTIDESLMKKVQYGIEFYQGFILATDSIVKKGMNIKLNIFDTANDLTKVAEILKDSSLNKADLIIGPLYFDEFVKVADFAKKHNINIVSPVKQSNKILLGNSHVSKVASSEPVMLDFIGKYIVDSLTHKNILMVYPDNVKERRRVELIDASCLRNVKQQTDSTHWRLPKKIHWDPKRFVEIKMALDLDKKNVIVVPSDNRIFVTQLMNMLSGLRNYDIQMVGLDSWENFDNIDVAYFHDLNVYLVTTDFIDYQKSEIQDFERAFNDKYEEIPGKYAFLGFDVAWYYLKLLKQYGVNIQAAYRLDKTELLSHKFNFVKTGIESGYENHSIYLVRYKDYELQQVY